MTMTAAEAFTYFQPEVMHLSIYILADTPTMSAAPVQRARAWQARSDTKKKTAEET